MGFQLPAAFALYPYPSVVDVVVDRVLCFSSNSSKSSGVPGSSLESGQNGS